MDKKILIEDLRKKFPIARYKKGIILEDLAVSSGQQDVIDYIERLSSNDRLK